MNLGFSTRTKRARRRYHRLHATYRLLHEHRGPHLLPPPLPLEQTANKACVGGADGSALPNASVRLVVVDPLGQHQPRDCQRARSDWSAAAVQGDNTGGFVRYVS